MSTEPAGTGNQNRVSNAVSTSSQCFQKSIFYSLIRGCSVPARTDAFIESLQELRPFSRGRSRGIEPASVRGIQVHAVTLKNAGVIQFRCPPPSLPWSSIRRWNCSLVYWAALARAMEQLIRLSVTALYRTETTSIRTRNCSNIHAASDRDFRYELLPI